MVKRRKAKTKRTDENKLPTQIIGNIGLFHVCYELSRRGFNVVPTSRNTKAVDIIVASADFKKHATVQVKATTINIGVYIGTKKKFPDLNSVIAETSAAKFWIYVWLDAKCGYQIKQVAAWEGDDRILPRCSGKTWWYEPWSHPKRTDDKIKLKWAKQQGEDAWNVIENFFNKKGN